MSRFEGLEPKHLWKYFGDFTEIPRPSKKEARIQEYLKKVARDKSIECQQDAIGNILFRVPATPGRESAPIVVLQNHVDMVAEKNADTVFDFDTQPIPVWIDGDWIRTKGTTLGADNGLGCAMALALLDDKQAEHGPLEMLFTMDEEQGLTGASRLDGSMLRGRVMLNLDTEEEGEFCIGCAGGITAQMEKEFPREKTDATSSSLQFTLRGLRGGHSGMNIVQNRGNALRMLSRALWHVAKEVPLQLFHLEGGSKHNAIPREAFARVAVAAQNLEKAKSIFQKQIAILRTEFGSSEPELEGVISTTPAVSEALSASGTINLFSFLMAMPNGVASMSRDLPGLVETSSNLAIVRTAGATVSVLVSIRSSVMEARDGLVSEIEALCQLSGWRCQASEGYSAWRPNAQSPLLARAKAVWQKNTGNVPHANAVHAGLECGVIMDKCPGMDAISFGPNIRGAHSPAECAQISSTARVYGFLKDLLQDLSR